LFWITGIVIPYLSSVIVFQWTTIVSLGFCASVFLQYCGHVCKQKVLLMGKLVLVLFVCGISWYAVFPSHSWAHIYVGFLSRHLLPVAAIGFAMFFYVAWHAAKQVVSYSRALLLFWGLLLLCFCGLFVWNSSLPWNPAVIADSRDFTKAAVCLRTVTQQSGVTDVVGVNYFRFPFIRYYADRQVAVVFTVDEFRALAELPAFFLFMPYNNDAAQQLYSVLQEKYDILFRCKSQRFPVIVYRRKS
jgi:hypothetical protein